MKEKKKVEKPGRIPDKLMPIIKVFLYFAEFHRLDGKKPNRKFRRAMTKGVKIGNNSKLTKSRKKDGSLRRIRMTIA